VARKVQRLVDVQRLERDRRPYRMPAVGVVVAEGAELVRVRGDGIVHMLRDRERGDRKTGAGQLLGQRHHVRLDAVGTRSGTSRHRQGWFNRGQHRRIREDRMGIATSDAVQDERIVPAGYWSDAHTHHRTASGPQEEIGEG